MPDRGWVIWYEDEAGPGDPHIFLSRASAELRIKELLEAVIGEEETNLELRELVHDEDSADMVSGPTAQLNIIKEEVAQGNIMDALSEWETYALDYGTRHTVVVKEADIFP